MIIECEWISNILTKRICTKIAKMVKPKWYEQFVDEQQQKKNDHS